MELRNQLFERITKSKRESIPSNAVSHCEILPERTKIMFLVTIRFQPLEAEIFLKNLEVPRICFSIQTRKLCALFYFVLFQRFMLSFYLFCSVWGCLLIVACRRKVLIPDLFSQMAFWRYVRMSCVESCQFRPEVVGCAEFMCSDYCGYEPGKDFWSEWIHCKIIY